MKENKTLYGFKILAAIFVVFIHIMFPGTMGVVIKNIARFAVPFFFVISGYFWNNVKKYESDYDKTKRRLERLIKLAVYSLLLYFAVNVGLYVFRGELTELPGVYLNCTNWLNLILYNYTTPFFGVGHLWYMLALIYVYFIVIIVEKKSAWNKAYKISIVLLGVMLATQFISYFLIELPGYLYRNWLLMGFPMFVVGRYIKDHEEIIKNVSLPFIILLYIVLLAIETIIFKDSFQLLISSLLGCVILMKVAIEKPDIIIFSGLGKKYSQWMYVYHYLFVIAIGIVASRLNLKLLEWIQPIIVVLLTLGFSYLTNPINKWFLK